MVENVGWAAVGTVCAVCHHWKDVIALEWGFSIELKHFGHEEKPGRPTASPC